MPGVNKVTSFAILLGSIIVASCGAPPRAAVPALTPENAMALLRYNPKAQTWITYVKKQNPTCDYKLELPDQMAQPTSIDLDHIVVCGGRPSPKEFDASVSFEFDRSKQKWVIRRFAS